MEGFKNKLYQIDHYSRHREMIPFIGANFMKHRILIISESHFMPKKEQEQPSDEWYSSNFDSSILEGNTNTNNVMLQHFSKKGHVLFRNIENALKTVDSSMDLNDIAWYNFFQKPARFGLSIKPTAMDKEIALETFEEVLKVLKPEIVVFVSSLSFGCLSKHREWNDELKCHQFKNYTSPIGIVPHPTSRWWNTVCKAYNNKTGKEKFINFINNQLN
jgi:hypothetical protein